MPDVAVILTAERVSSPTASPRAASPTDGTSTPPVPSREVDLYREAAAYLMDGGVDVLLLDKSVYTPSDVARRIADAIPALPLPSVPSPAPSTPQGT